MMSVWDVKNDVWNYFPIQITSMIEWKIYTLNFNPKRWKGMLLNWHQLKSWKLKVNHKCKCFTLLCIKTRVSSVTFTNHHQRKTQEWTFIYIFLIHSILSILQSEEVSISQWSSYNNLIQICLSKKLKLRP